MPEAEMIGSPDHQRMIPIEPGQRKIIIERDGKLYECPIRNRQIFWNEKKEVQPKKKK